VVMGIIWSIGTFCMIIDAYTTKDS
jgi:hypothetical protein